MGKVTIMASSIGRPVEILSDVPPQQGRFHAWSTDFDELRYGVVQFPVAIVELDNGTLRSVPLYGVRFLDRE